MKELSDRLERWAQAEGSTLAFGLFRIIVALMAIRHLIGYARDWATSGFFGDFFYVPYVSWLPQPNETVYLMVVFGGILSGAFLLVGYKTRVASVTCFILVTYHLLMNQIWYLHNRYFLILALFLVCVAPVSHSLSLDALRRKLPPLGPQWPAFLIKAQMTLIYLGSASSKTLDSAWRGGEVLTGRNLGQMWSEWMPGFVTQLVPPETAVRLLTAQALVSEFFLAIFLWVPRTRRLAFWWGIIFHGYIEVQWSVLTFSYLTLGTFFVFADLKPGARQWFFSERSPFQRCVSWLLPMFDWLFQIRVATHRGARPRFITPDGTVYRGWMSWIMLGANLPVTYVFCYPLSWLRFTGWGRGPEPVETVARPSREIAVHWMLLWFALYLVFLGLVNLYAPLRLDAMVRRFWDLPWYFVLMCLITAAYHRTVVWPGRHHQGALLESRAPNQIPAGASGAAA